jgi:hypothetical protein
MDKVEMYTDHWVVPFRRIKSPGGICDERGNMVLESLRGPARGREGNVRAQVGRAPGQPSGPLGGGGQRRPAIFMGHLTCHYGHFLIETLDRFWVFLELDKSFFVDKDIVFIGHQHDISVRGYHVLDCIMESLDIRGCTFVKVDSAKKYEKLYLPEPASSLFFPMAVNDVVVDTMEAARDYEVTASYQRALFHAIAAHVEPRYGDLKLYISRAGGVGDRPTTLYDEMFRQMGFTVICPTSRTFKRDLALYKSAKIIVGVDGTGLHNVGFMQHPSRCMIELKHRKDKFLRKTRGLSVGQYFFNWFNRVPYKVIPGFRMTLDEVRREITTTLEAHASGTSIEHLGFSTCETAAWLHPDKGRHLLRD